MRMLDVDKLIPHPKNSYFFDDIDGEPWVAFLESIETSGVIEPIIVDGSDLTIVSGHQRVRACKKLGITQVAVEERHFESDDERLKQLIETNIRQRGVGNTNPVKFGRCIAELERIYGIRHGGDRASGNNFPLKSQSELADEIGITAKQLRNYKSLTDLIPELQDAVQNGQITATTAMGLVKKLSPEEQRQLAESIMGTEKVTSQQVKDLIAENKRQALEIIDLKTENASMNSVNKQLVKEARQASGEKQVVEVEVFPDDYEEAKKQAEIAVKDKEAMKRQYDEMAEKWKRSESEKQRILEEQDRPEAEQARRIRENSIFFCAGVSAFLEKFGGYSYLMSEINELPYKDRNAVLEAVKAINRWSEEMLNSTVSEVVE